VFRLSDFADFGPILPRQGIGLHSLLVFAKLSVPPLGPGSYLHSYEVLVSAKLSVSHALHLPLPCQLLFAERVSPRPPT